MAAIAADSLPDDPLEYLFSLEQFGVKLDLDNIHAIVAGLGHPERAYASVHIAGTNGKGSVTAMLESMLRHAGYRTGRYTSPHLIALTERFAIDGVPVDERQLRDAVTHVRRTVVELQRGGRLGVHPTFFEITTATAFEIFRRAGIEVAVCEVGLGGRLDATNVLIPKVCAITTIARDHEQYLGDSIALIAREKAGIIKPGVPIVAGDLSEEAMHVVERIALEKAAPLIRASEGTRLSTSGEPPLWRLTTPEGDYGPLRLSLAGAHQAQNARLAVRVAEVLSNRGTRVPREAAEHGLSTVVWPGRLEHIQLAGGRDLVLDAAHNPAGAATLAAFLASERRRRTLVFAAMRDKDVAGILTPLLPHVAAVVVTRAANPRSETLDALAASVQHIAPQLAITAAPTAATALESAWQHTNAVVVAGSIFLLGDVMKALGRS